MAKSPDCSTTDCARWFADQVPDEWFETTPEVLADRDEIIVTGALAVGDAHDPHVEIHQFRERTRHQRMQIAEVAQARWQRHVTWGVRCSEVEVRFTHAAVPVMTRLRFEERAVLDTLIDAGVARSRSEALSWCVGQVGAHQQEWIDRLREAMSEVERIRSEGPQ